MGMESNAKQKLENFSGCTEEAARKGNAAMAAHREILELLLTEKITEGGHRKCMN